jgi:predicted porin
VDGADLRYLTVGATYVFGNWNVAAYHALRDDEQPGADAVRDRISQLSFGYRFEFGLGIDVGYARAREAGIDTDILGLLLRYEYEF